MSYTKRELEWILYQSSWVDFTDEEIAESRTLALVVDRSKKVQTAGITGVLPDYWDSKPHYTLYLSIICAGVISTITEDLALNFNAEERLYLMDDLEIARSVMRKSQTNNGNKA